MRSDTTPIIPGFYPDPTICRVGDDYYLANSSFEYFPGAPLWHSTDLVTWRQVGNILTTREQFDEGASRPSQGIYGSTLRFRDGLFYFITTNCNVFSKGQLIVTARDPRGPWSEPVYVPDAIGIDPDVCWDDDGICLLTWKLLDFENDDTGIRQAPIDPATGHLLDEPTALWQGTGGAHPEGPHLYKVGHWWYLMLAEGGTERGHMVTVARSRSARGPFEANPANPIFTRRSSDQPVQSVGHADLVETTDGDWAIVHLGTRPHGSSPGFHVLGRETFVAGVDWVDGWPTVDSARFEVPLVDTSVSEDFAGPTLHPRWVVPSGDLGSLSVHGGLRVEAGSYLCMRVRDLRWEASAVLDRGGFELRMDPGHGYGVRIEDATATAYMRVAGVTTELGSVAVGDGATVATVAARDPAEPPLILGGAGPDDIVLRVEWDGGRREWPCIDGRYLSTEVAAGFTGRVLALGDASSETVARNVTYVAN